MNLVNKIFCSTILIGSVIPFSTQGLDNHSSKSISYYPDNTYNLCKKTMGESIDHRFDYFLDKMVNLNQKLIDKNFNFDLKSTKYTNDGILEFSCLLYSYSKEGIAFNIELLKKN